MTDDELKQAHNDWLITYTWLQEDGSIDFHKPRVRPPGLAVDPRELPQGVTP